jgi:hypothetical protein
MLVLLCGVELVAGLEAGRDRIVHAHPPE